jgi:dTDP-4-dehydrorhamnose reductase
MEMKIAVIGGEGFLGSEIVKALSVDNSVTVITSGNKSEYFGYPNLFFDCVVNANGNSRKYWANKNPLGDFELSTRSVYDSVLGLRYNRYVYISSVDASCNNYYGLNKRLSEEIVKSCCSDYTILRCSVLVGKDMKKGILKDILDGDTLHVTPDSSYQFITTKETANIVKAIIPFKLNKTLDVAGTGVLTVTDVVDMLKKSIKYSSELDKQSYYQDVSELNKYYRVKTSKEYVLEAVNERVE